MSRRLKHIFLTQVRRSVLSAKVTLQPANEQRGRQNCCVNYNSTRTDAANKHYSAQWRFIKGISILKWQMCFVVQFWEIESFQVSTRSASAQESHWYSPSCMQRLYLWNRSFR